jgi:hypothetical protein
MTCYNGADYDSFHVWRAMFAHESSDCLLQLLGLHFKLPYRIKGMLRDNRPVYRGLSRAAKNHNLNKIKFLYSKFLIYRVPPKNPAHYQQNKRLTIRYVQLGRFALLPASSGFLEQIIEIGVQYVSRCLLDL